MSFYETFFGQPEVERVRIAEAAGLSLAYIKKHTYTQPERSPKFHFHNALGLDRASNGQLSFLDTTEGEIDWPFVLERLKAAQKAGRIGKVKVAPMLTHNFDGFWKEYPRKLNKPGAMKSWRAQVCDKVADAILVDLRRRKASEDWTKDGGKFIPHPTTYLNQRRWEEVIEVAQPTSDVFAGAV